MTGPRAHPHAVTAVAAGIVSLDGRYLITKRPKGSHLEGLWEFPGGKCEQGESLEACLHRELWEELRIRVDNPVLLHVQRHAYPEKTVEVSFYRCRLAEGEATPLPGSDVRWVTPPELALYEFPDADQSVLTILQNESGAETT